MVQRLEYGGTGFIEAALNAILLSGPGSDPVRVEADVGRVVLDGGVAGHCLGVCV